MMEGPLMAIGLFVITFVLGTIGLTIKLSFKTGIIFPTLVIFFFIMWDRAIDLTVFNLNISHLKDADPKILLLFMIILPISMIPMIIKILRAVKFAFNFVGDLLYPITSKFTSKE